MFDLNEKKPKEHISDVKSIVTDKPMSSFDDLEKEPNIIVHKFSTKILDIFFQIDLLAV